MLVKQSTARTIIVGPILDSDGAAKTDEVVGSVLIHKNGAAAAALDGSATLTHSQTGFYRLALTANDLDTLGVVELSLNSGTNSMPVKACNVIPANAYDSLVAGSDTLTADVTQFGGSNGTFSGGRPEVNASHIDGSAAAATNLKQSCLAIQTITVQTAEAAANTATSFDTDLPIENDDYYGSADGGLVIAFISGAANQFQTRRIVASSTGTANTRITLEEALDATPADGNVAVVLGRITELA